MYRVFAISAAEQANKGWSKQWQSKSVNKTENQVSKKVIKEEKDNQMSE